MKTAKEWIDELGDAGWAIFEADDVTAVQSDALEAAATIADRIVNEQSCPCKPVQIAREIRRLKL